MMAYNKNIGSREQHILGVKKSNSQTQVEHLSTLWAFSQRTGAKCIFSFPFPTQLLNCCSSAWTWLLRAPLSLAAEMAPNKHPLVCVTLLFKIRFSASSVMAFGNSLPIKCKIVVHCSMASQQREKLQIGWPIVSRTPKADLLFVLCSSS